MTVGERIVLHLSQYTRQRESFQCPEDVTQKGISTKLGISRAHAAIELKRLKEMGEVDERVAHVTKAKTRRKVYFLNLRGENRAREMRDYAKEKKVKIVDSAGELEVVDGQMAINVLKTDLNLDEAKAYEVVLTNAEIDPTDFSRKEKPATTDDQTVEDFFGREGERKYFEDWFNGIEPRIMIVLGIPGVGKTRLAKRLASNFDGPCFYHAIKEWDTPELVLGSMSAFLESQGKKALKSRLGSIIDWDDVSRILKRDLRGCLVLFDDVHKSIKLETFLGIFKEMKGFKGRIMATSRSRPYFYDASDTLLSRRVEEYQLTGLNREATEEFIHHLDPKSTNDKIDNLYEMTTGHPLYLEFVLARGEKKARSEFEGYLHDQVLSELSAVDENALKKICVHRYPVTKEAVEGTSSIVLKNLSRLLLLREEGNTYSANPTTKSIFYSKMDPRQRKEAHSLAADYHLKTEDDFERLYHLVEAGRYPEAARLCLKGGEKLAEENKAEDILEFIRLLEPKVKYTKRLQRLKDKISNVSRKE
jgi:adenylate kinase family enzyme/DNA-binding MarR family transcriptional regulator